MSGSRPNRSSRCVTTLACLVAFALLAGSAPGAAEPSSDEASEMRSISWLAGPAKGSLGVVATIQIPAGFAFTGQQGTKKFMEITHNPVSGDELGVLLPTDSTGWFAVFEFEEVGYVKDDDKNKLDADKLLASIRKGNESANEERKKRGWEPLEIVGWYQTPRYDPVTHNLVWAIRGRSDTTDVVNYSTRILGRRGVMQIDLVASPEDLAASLPQFQAALTGLTYSPGNSYAEYRQGDKIAKYGLTALIVGGAAVAAAKSGVLAKLLKPLIIGVMGLFAALARWFKRVFGGEDNPSGGGGTTT